MSRSKPYWEMTTAELAQATKEFDDLKFVPRTKKMTAAQREQLRQFRQWQRINAHRAKWTLSLDPKLNEQTDDYAAHHGITFSDVVSDALRKLMQKKSA